MNATDRSEQVILPREIRTSRLVLRPWQAEDAPDLRPILEANRGHIGPWIPARVAEPAPVPVLADRLAGFAADFAANREWRFGIFSSETSAILGEVGLFSRSAAGRVPFAEADRVELGYWLRADETGKGLVAEAARALLTAAATVPRFSHAEIRCDARNAPSVAVAKRLGFVLAQRIAESPVAPEGQPVQLLVWTSDLSFFSRNEQHDQSR